MVATRNNRIDPVLVSVLDSRFSGITDEMATSLMRTSRSPIFFEVRDFATAIFTSDIRLIAQKDYAAILAGALPTAVKAIAKTTEGDIDEGDIFIHNDSYNGNNHPPDVNIVKPIFYRGKLVFWAATKGHLADIGGGGIAGYNPKSTTIWDDGLVIPVCKLYQKGTYNKSIMDLIARNSKAPELVTGDIACEVGAVTLAERRLTALIERYGLETLYAAIDEIIVATEKEAKDKIRQMPDGVYYGEKSIDHDAIDRDKPITIRVKIIKQGDELTVDYSDSDPQCKGYMNSTRANTVSATYTPIFLFLPGAGVKRNEGFLRSIKIITRKGTLLDAEFPAPVTMCTVSTTGCLTEAILLALSEAVPEWASAAAGNTTQNCIRGLNPRTGKIISGLDFSVSTLGGGATEGYDGWPAYGSRSSLGMLRWPDFEIIELVWPMRYLQHEQIIDSGAPGKFRGGLAHMYRAQFLTDLECVLMGSGIRDFTAPSGLFGGKSARPNYYVIHRKDGTKESVDVGSFFEIRTGDIKEQYIQEGGGFGDPWERDPEKVRDDVYNEIVSIEGAKRDYGVIIDSVTLNVNVEATRELREKHKKKY